MLSIHLICFDVRNYNRQRIDTRAHTKRTRLSQSTFATNQSFECKQKQKKNWKNWKSRQKLSPIFYTEICTDYVRSLAWPSNATPSPMIYDSRFKRFHWMLFRSLKSKSEKWIDGAPDPLHAKSNDGDGVPNGKTFFIFRCRNTIWASVNVAKW